MERQSAEPPGPVASLSELVGIAHAVETEAIRRYTRLAEEMRRRGEAETAEAFEAMAREEASHVAAVERWARGLGQPVPADGRFRWRLPADLAASWEEVSGSALLNPYRAYAIAVDNEQRAFAFYAYLAASAGDGLIAREAEALAREELQHAATLRIWRRAAWRRQRVAPGRAAAEAAPIRTSDQLAAAIRSGEAEIAACHMSLARRLRRVGDQPGARLLEDLAVQAAARAREPVPEACSAEECAAQEPLALLLAAQRPLERLCVSLEAALLAATDEPMQAAAQHALSEAIARIARLGRRIEELEAVPDPRP